MSTDTPSTPRALFTAAAKSIQSYVLASDKLREMTGATLLIEDFCGEKFTRDILDALNLPTGQVILGAAGHVSVLFPTLDEARKAAALWPFAAALLAPGLEVHTGAASLENGYKAAVDECERQIARSRNRPPAALPAAAPPHLRNQRSGLVAVALDHKDPDCEANNGQPPPVDSAARAKRLRRDRFRMEADSNGIFPLFGLSDETAAGSFDDIARSGGGSDRDYLAVIHADGNGFGKMFTDLGESLKNLPAKEAADIFSEVSAAVRDTGAAAVRQAVAAVTSKLGEDRQSSKKITPWLPIVHAGDDVTLVIRAGLAYDFLKTFLTAFEEESAAALNTVQAAHPGLDLRLPEKLTAGGAIVYCKAQHPFSQAYALCESLAKECAKGDRAKGPGGAKQSALAFHRITASTSPEEFEDLAAEIRCADDDQPPLQLACHTWLIHDTGARLCFHSGALEQLRDALAEYPASSRRQLLSDLRTNRHQAVARLQRMIQIGSEGGRGDKARRIPPEKLQSALSALHGAPDALWRDSDNPDGPGDNKAPALSALADALTLLEVTR